MVTPNSPALTFSFLLLSRPGHFKMIIDIPHGDAEADALPDYATLMRSHPPRSRSYSPLIYSFTEWIHDTLSGSMLLMPPPEAQDQRPLYKVTADLDLNPFVPMSYVTRIHRAGTELGELVGEFS
ncbi:hypothetical protein BDQ17DRAFT_1433277 [Cyathus striatus]|nr:hypothetical protein BDQ17DRAFT_1433277 [Cyathus striatus]